MRCAQCGALLPMHSLACPLIWGPPLLQRLDPTALDWAKTNRTETTMRTEELRPPRLNQAVHYRAFGTPGGEYPPACRAAIITEVGAWVANGEPQETQEGEQRYRLVPQRWDPAACTLFVANPSGMFLNGPIPRHEPAREMVVRSDGSEGPGRIYLGGTWHSMAGCDA